MLSKTKLTIIIITSTILSMFTPIAYVTYSNNVLNMMMKENYTQFLMNSSAASVFLICLETIYIVTIVACVLYLKKTQIKQ